MASSIGTTEAPDLTAAIADCGVGLRRYAMHLTRNSADADDLVHDSIERAMRKSYQFEMGTNLQQWMVVIMRSLFINGTRKRKHARGYVDMQKLMGDTVVLPVQQDRLAFQEVSQALGKLSDDHQQTIRLVAIEQRSHKEAAEIMGVAVATAKTRLFRARESLNRLLEDVQQSASGDPVLAAGPASGGNSCAGRALN